MGDIGNGALMLAFVCAAYGSMASVAAGRTKSELLARSGERAVRAAFLLLTVGIVALVSLFLQDDFGTEYVAGHSNRDLATYFKVSALWSGQEGSLLFWSWLLAGYSFFVTIQSRSRNRSLMPWVTSVLGATLTFFLLLNYFIANPFRELQIVHGDGAPLPFAPPDGQGLNPLLQHPAMLIHPPILYLGYIGFIVPFAFAIAAMVTRQQGDEWIRTTRRWTLAAWLFQGTGIILGGRWAYVELGWGGYWAWDPVENASLMPWLTGTAFLHSVIVTEKKRMLKVWNMVLIVLTYLLCIFGTFLTRSGLMSSVHAFAESQIGPWFAAFLASAAVLSFGLLFRRLEYLRTASRLESMVSRESSFLFNNLVFLVACFAVFAGTLFPVLSEWVQGTKITVGPPFFNMIERPIGLLLLFLMGVGPLLAWRRSSPSSLKKNFMMPLGISLLGGLACGIWMYSSDLMHGWSLLSLMLCVFVTFTIVLEFWRGARARMRSRGGWFGQAIGGLIMRNTRRYGGYVVHFGVVLIFLGFTGSAFNRELKQEISQGDEVDFAGYTLVIEKVTSGETPNYVFDAASVSIQRNGREVTKVYPSRRFYTASEQPTSEVSMYSTLNRDLYLVLSGHSHDGERAVLTAYSNPLVNWVWIGGFIMILGTGICMIPERRGKLARSQAETEETAGTRKAAG